MDSKEVLLLWFRNFFDKKSTGGGIVNNNNNNNNNSNNNNKQNRRPLDLAALQLAEELHKPIVRKFKKKKNLFWN